MGSHQPSSPHILIIGAGVGGFTLAQALTKKSIPFTIFERDPDADSRAQGWALAVHTIIDRLTAAFPDYMPPIRETVSHLAPLLHLPTQFVMYKCTDPEQRTGVETTPENGLLRANRRRLREWLRTNIQVQYNKQVVGVEEDHGGVTVRFKDGTEARGSMAVGADGTRSADPLQDVPIASIVGEVELSGEDLVHQLELAHSGAAIVYPAENPDDYVMTFIGLNEIRPDGKSALYYWLVYFQNDEDSPSREAYEKACASRATLLEMAKKKTNNFHSAFRRVIDRTLVEGMKFPPLVLRDMVLSAKDIPAGRVTLLGDAAHCMVPFRAEGGIRAMEDALELADYIERILQGEDIKVLMTEYRATLVNRGAKSVTESRQAFENMRKMWKQIPPMILGIPTGPIPKRKIVI